MLETANTGNCKDLNPGALSANLVTPQATRAARFNRRCRWAAALWLFLALPLSLALRPTYQDFSAYYLAGSVVRMHRWDLLYPRHLAGNPYFIFSGYEFKPEQLTLAQQLGIHDLMPFLGLPWNALLFVPFAFFSFKVGHALWIGVLLVCTWRVCDLAGESYEWSAGQPSRMRGVATLTAAFSVLAYRAVRVGNVSPPMALALGAAAFSLLRSGRRADLKGAAWLYLGGLLKYATLALFPLLIAARRWRMLGWTILAGAITVFIALAIAGPMPFVDFLQTIAATFGGSTPLRPNQSIWGMLLRIVARPTLPPAMKLGVQALQWGTLLGLLILIFRQKRSAWQQAPAVFAASASLICWLLIFSPVFWEHYAIYLTPVWGWLMWEARLGAGSASTDTKSSRHPEPSQIKASAIPYPAPNARQSKSRVKSILAGIAIALAWLPLPALVWLHIPEPLNSMMLWSCCIFLAFGVRRLWKNASSSAISGSTRAAKRGRS